MINTKTINFLTDKVLSGNGDSDAHLLTLFSIALSSKSKILLELGVREGATTLPLLEAAKMLNSKLYSVDIIDQPMPDSDNWVYVKKDAIQFLKEWPVNETIDLVYIDDWHSYEHVKKELELLDRLVSPNSIILIHDLMYGNTCPFYHTDLTLKTGQWADGGPYRAVAELNPQFWEFSTLPWGNGLTVLRKKYSSKFKQK